MLTLNVKNMCILRNLKIAALKTQKGRKRPFCLCMISNAYSIHTESITLKLNYFAFN